MVTRLSREMVRQVRYGRRSEGGDYQRALNAKERAWARLFNCFVLYKRACRYRGVDDHRTFRQYCENHGLGPASTAYDVNRVYYICKHNTRVVNDGR